ncbi:MAG TPA: DUF3828 domain-containing protein [Alphaproteobacteria bacterium]|nr:DUF3828 domain-containing protein [Alphaproteobacteria bacterium]
MNRRRFACLALAALLAAPLAARPAAATDDAVAFLTDLYARYQGPDAPGLPLDEAATRRLFAPPLAALILKDAAQSAAQGEPGRLNGDPFVNAQDWQIDRVDIAVAPKGADRAEGTVAFRNQDRPERLRLDLARGVGGWQIAEIHYLTADDPAFATLSRLLAAE